MLFLYNNADILVHIMVQLSIVYMWKDLHTHADYMHVARYYWLSDNCSSSKAIQIASTVYTYLHFSIFIGPGQASF